MKKKSYFGLFLLLSSVLVYGQADSAQRDKPKPSAGSLQVPALKLKDSATRADTVTRPVHQSFPSSNPYDSGAAKIIRQNPFFGIESKPVSKIMVRREIESKDWIFYLFTFLLLVFGMFRLYFSRYFSNLNRLFFNTTLKQKQIREQMLQAALPSMLFNAFFILSAGVYAFFLAEFFKLNGNVNKWLFLASCILLVALLYLIKFLALKLTGWIFDRKGSADAYIFIIFFLNKLLGIYLIPFSILIAYATGNLQAVAVTLSLVLIAGFYLYRFILSYSAVRNELKISLLHFFLYLCAFEIVPVILIYKVLLDFLGKSA